jgi:hypothetical protein
MDEALTLGADGVAVVAIVYRAFQLQAEQDGVFASSGTYDMEWMCSLTQKAVRNAPAFSSLQHNIVVNSRGAEKCVARGTK